jgi:hypothetical protein
VKKPVLIVMITSLLLSLIAVGGVAWLVIQPKRFVSEPYRVSASAKARADEAEATARRLEAPASVAGLSPRQAQYIVSRLCLIFRDEYPQPEDSSGEPGLGTLVYLLQLQCKLGNWSRVAAEQAGALSP